MRCKLVAGNWKLNGTRASIEALMGEILQNIKTMDQVQIAVCPPYVYIPMVQALVGSSKIQLGAQDVAIQEKGAFTGEVSAPMLKEFGCSLTLVGHSERRSLFAEKDEDTAQKFAAARKQGLTPVLCVGESLDEREDGLTEVVVARQLDAVIALEGIEAFNEAIIAYEPVWAIGTGKTATPEQAQEVHAFIRGKLASLNKSVAEKVQILYGGSVKGANATELFAMPDIDGGLIGGASLDAQDFIAICQAGNQG